MHQIDTALLNTKQGETREGEAESSRKKAYKDPEGLDYGAAGQERIVGKELKIYMHQIETALIGLALPIHSALHQYTPPCQGTEYFEDFLLVFSFFALPCAFSPPHILSFRLFFFFHLHFLLINMLSADRAHFSFHGGDVLVVPFLRVRVRTQ